ncbi:MAG: BRCT domain-containing protein, partial [Bacilli bacterium]
SGNYTDKYVIDMGKSDSLDSILPSSLKGNLNSPLKRKAIEFYQQWKLIGATNPYFGQVIINRTGWSHITRQGRPIARIETSFNLLPIAARIINDVSKWRTLTAMRRYENRKDNYICHIDFIGLTAKVILKERNSSDVMVILKRETRFKKNEWKALVENNGGKFVDDMTLKVDYLVICNKGNSAWAHVSYGRKFEQAKKWQNEGNNIRIITEDDFVALVGLAGK